MTYSNLFEDILQEIIVEYSDQLPDSDTLFESVGFEPLPTVANSLIIALPTSLSSLRPIVEGILKFSSASTFNGTEDVPDYSNLKIKNVQYENEKNKRLFILNDQDLSVLDSTHLYSSEYDDKLMSIAIKICYSPKSRIELIRFLTEQHTHATYHCIYDTTLFNDTIFKCWDIYHYALLRYLNDGNIIKRECSLDFSPSQIYPTLIFDADVQYNQFIDIYDVFSEFNHAQDILGAFVKMYQILEYVIYRKELVKIIEGSSIKQSFVRQIKGIDRKYLNSERDAFCSHLFKVIDSFNGEITNADITQDMIDFCGKYFEKTNSGISYINTTICNDVNVLNKSIAKFIYDTRCAIVHNKEAEFHITYFNYNEYAAIIPLMRIVIRGITKRVIKLLNIPDSDITFPIDHLKLY